MRVAQLLDEHEGSSLESIDPEVSTTRNRFGLSCTASMGRSVVWQLLASSPPPTREANSRDNGRILRGPRFLKIASRVRDARMMFSRIVWVMVNGRSRDGANEA